jgi:type II secretory pathway pseudopilin PulG
MNLPRPKPLESRRAPTSAFTMIEIALSLAVIGIALVSIIGILPRAMDVQKNNRRETIINQDANYFIESIRGGARGLDDLTNYVIAITNYWAKYNSFNFQTSFGHDDYDYYSSKVTSIIPSPANNIYRLTNGQRIVGVLSTPKYIFVDSSKVTQPGSGVVFQSNYVVGYFRAISGAATEKFPQTNAAVQESAFSYRLISELIPYTTSTNRGGFFDSTWTNYMAMVNFSSRAIANAYVSNWVSGVSTNSRLESYVLNTNIFLNPTSQAEFYARANYWLTTRQMTPNLYDLRLFFRWPLLPGNRLGNTRQNYRAMVTGALTNDPAGGPTYFMQANTYVKTP